MRDLVFIVILLYWVFTAAAFHVSNSVENVIYSPIIVQYSHPHLTGVEFVEN